MPRVRTLTDDRLSELADHNKLGRHGSSEWTLQLPPRVPPARIAVVQSALDRRNAAICAFSAYWFGDLTGDDPMRKGNDYSRDCLYKGLRASLDDADRTLLDYGIEWLTTDGGAFNPRGWCGCNPDGEPRFDFYFHAVGAHSHGYGCATCGKTTQGG